MGLGMPDFRAAERTFQLLTQVAGRAGRGSLPGIVLVQTINPDHYAVRLAAAQDYQGFYEKELNFRRMMHYPPFSAMANVLVRSEKKEMAMRMSTELGYLLNPPPEKLRVMGPAEAPVPRLEERIPLSVPDQGGQPQGAQRIAPEDPQLRPGAQVGRHRPGDRCRPADPDVVGPLSGSKSLPEKGTDAFSRRGKGEKGTDAFFRLPAKQAGLRQSYRIPLRFLARTAATEDA
jgi:hypothetical protein